MTAIVVVTNIGCKGTCFLSINKTRANATAPRRPRTEIKLELILKFSEIFHFKFSESMKSFYVNLKFSLKI